MKLARGTFLRWGQPDRQLVVSRTLGYHGTNIGGTALQGLPLGPTRARAHGQLRRLSKMPPLISSASSQRRSWNTESRN